MSTKKWRWNPRTKKLDYVGEFKTTLPWAGTFQAGDLDDIQKDIDRRKHDKKKKDKADRIEKIIRATEIHSSPDSHKEEVGRIERIKERAEQVPCQE